jgi:glycosyltransferase involved in cell wall biosynthesis
MSPARERPTDNAVVQRTSAPADGERHRVKGRDSGREAVGRRMRIAIYHNLPSGGGKRALLEMARGLKVRHSIDVFSLSSAEHDFCDLRPVSDHHMLLPFTPLSLLKHPFGRLNAILRTVDLLRVRGVQRHVATLIDGGQYDVVFVHNCRIGQTPALLSFLRTPTVYFCAEPPRSLSEPRVDRPYSKPDSLRRLLEAVDPGPSIYAAVLGALDRAAVRKASMVLANSAFSRETLYRVYGVNARICYLGVDCGRFFPLPTARGDFVLSVGAIHPCKGYDFLIRSLACIPAARRPRLVIVTNSAEARETQFLRTLAENLDVELELQLLLPEDELVLRYNQAQLTVYTPILEPFGLVPLESMACGTAVVGVREGGVRESVQHRQTGLLVDRDEGECAQAVLELLEDAAQRRAYGMNGPGYVQREWPWSRTVENLERFLAAACRTEDSGGGSHPPGLTPLAAPKLPREKARANGD